jgi:hypothetical protein
MFDIHSRYIIPDCIREDKETVALCQLGRRGRTASGVYVQVLLPFWTLHDLYPV